MICQVLNLPLAANSLHFGQDSLDAIIFPLYINYSNNPKYYE